MSLSNHFFVPNISVRTSINSKQIEPYQFLQPSVPVAPKYVNIVRTEQYKLNLFLMKSKAIHYARLHIY